MHGRKNWTRERGRRFLCLLLVIGLALTLRLVFIAHVHPIPHTDFAWYRDKAVSIQHGLGYVNHNHPTAYFPIGFPLFLALVYSLFGEHWLSGVLANVLLNAATAGLLYLIGEKLHGWRVGLVAGILMACYLPHIEWSSVLGSEMLFTFLFFLTVWLWLVRPPRDRQWGWLIASGIVLGLDCLVRPVLLLLPIVLLLYGWIARVGWRQGILRAGLVTILMLATISPMTIRNYVAFHQIIPVSTNGGVNLWQGNNPHANGQYYWPKNPAENPFLNYVDNEVADNKVASHMAMSYIERHPLHTIKLGFTKWKHLFEGVDNVQLWSVNQSQPPVSKATAHTIATIAWWNYVVVLALAILGLIVQAAVVARTKDWRPILLWLVIAYYIGLFFIFPAWDRMRAPIDPAFALLAGTFIGAVLTGRRFFQGPAVENGIMKQVRRLKIHGQSGTLET